MKFSEFMIRNRKKTKVSLYRLSQITGISRQQLSNYECGRSNPTIGNVELICKSLKVKFIIG